MDNRVAQTVSGTTTNYLWDEFSRYKDVILETNPSNTIGYTLAGGMLVSQTNNGNIDYFLQDAQNSTIGIADSSGAVTSSYAYDAFGNLDSSISGVSVETNYLYTGQQFDPVYTELYNLRARQYDPSIGRFSSRDKWAYNLGNPIELNRYGYTANNPVNYADPSGYGIISFAQRVIGAISPAPAIGFVVGGLVFGGVNAIWQALTLEPGEKIDWYQVAFWASVGAIAGATLGFSFAPLISGEVLFSVAVDQVISRLANASLGLATYTATITTINLVHNIDVSIKGEGEYRDLLSGWNPLDAGLYAFSGTALGVANAALPHGVSLLEKVGYYSLTGMLASSSQALTEMGFDYFTEENFSPCSSSYAYGMTGQVTNLVELMGKTGGIVTSLAVNTIIGSWSGAVAEDQNLNSNTCPGTR